MNYSSRREAVKVTLLATLLGATSGLWLVAPGLEAGVVVATSLAMLVTDAIVCRLFAAQFGLDGRRWGLAGLVLGVIAIAALVVVVERRAD